MLSVGVARAAAQDSGLVSQSRNCPGEGGTPEAGVLEGVCRRKVP